MKKIIEYVETQDNFVLSYNTETQDLFVRDKEQDNKIILSLSKSEMYLLFDGLRKILNEIS